ncbi:MAG: GMC family oxidoreductase [Deltaproteobacteria bacterium]|nr:GMC family oxidoreductase [Deltaproteobacteria bacterium]
MAETPPAGLRPGAIFDCSRGSPGERLTFEYVVVGSGAGGATAAWDLAAAGKEVLLLEAGADRIGSALTQRDGEMYDQMYAERGGRSTVDLSISVLQGKGLGGGTIINACDVVPASDEVLGLWAKTYGLGELAPEKVAPFAARALADLSASRIPEAALNRANQLLKAGTEAMGWQGEPMMHNRVDCVDLGTCLIGCPADAKSNTRFVAVPGALSHGAAVAVRARVERIEEGGVEQKRLVVSRLDALGREVLGTFEVRASRLILACNPVDTVALLRRSGLGNERVGRHLSLQPQLPFMALFEEEVRAFEGIPQAYAVTEFERFVPGAGLGGFRIEAIMGTPGIVASLVPFVGHEHKEMMTLYPRIAASLLLIPDAPVGEVRVEASGRPRVHYELTDDVRARMREAAKAAAEIYFAAGATRIIVPTMRPVVIERGASLEPLARMELPPAGAPLLSAHQQGGVRMGADAASSAATPEGEVRGTRGIHVLDSSGFPTSVSTHTMTGIIALSHLQTARMV